MADITVFKVDLSDSTFVAPLGRQILADRVEVEGDDDEEDGGGRGKLLVVGALAVAATVGGLAFVVARKVRGGDDADPPEESDWGDDDWDGDWDEEGRVEFESTVDDDAFSGGVDTERDEFDADEESSSNGAVAAVVGLLFLLFVTALVRRRRTEPDVEPDAVGRDAATPTVE
jgi:hypothetical protein